MGADTQIAIDLVSQHRVESNAYFRQWILWLGLGSAGAGATFLSLAANACDPNYAFRHLLPSFWLFLLGIVCAATSLLAVSFRFLATGEHFAAAHNREQANSAAKQLPTIISSPQRIADEMNAQQNSFIARARKEHERAEHSWKMRHIWNITIIGLLFVSSGSFVAGIGAPLIFVSYGGDLLGVCKHPR